MYVTLKSGKTFVIHPHNDLGVIQPEMKSLIEDIRALNKASTTKTPKGDSSYKERLSVASICLAAEANHMGYDDLAEHYVDKALATVSVMNRPRLSQLLESTEGLPELLLSMEMKYPQLKAWIND